MRKSKKKNGEAAILFFIRRLFVYSNWIGMKFNRQAITKNGELMVGFDHEDVTIHGCFADCDSILCFEVLSNVGDHLEFEVDMKEGTVNCTLQYNGAGMELEEKDIIAGSKEYVCADGKWYVEEDYFQIPEFRIDGENACMQYFIKSTPTKHWEL